MSCSPTSLEAPHVWADGGETSAGVSHEASATAARRGRAGLAETAGRDGTERSAAGARGAPPAEQPGWWSGKGPGPGSSMLLSGGSRRFNGESE